MTLARPSIRRAPAEPQGKSKGPVTNTTPARSSMSESKHGQRSAFAYGRLRMPNVSPASGGRDGRPRGGMGSAVLFRVASAIGPLLTVPLGLHQLGKESYGIWMVAASLTAFF